MQYCVHQAYIFFTVGQLWDKLANLRSYYCKELKKVTDSKKSGTGTDEVYTSKWCHFESLDSFLRAQVIPRRSTTNLVSYYFIFSALNTLQLNCIPLPWNLSIRIKIVTEFITYVSCFQCCAISSLGQ